MTDYLKKEIRDSISIFNSLRLWIMLKVPRMEDGNNFGVSIQKECIKRLVDAQDQVVYMLDCISQYYKNRGEAVTNVWFPCVGDL